MFRGIEWGVQGNKGAKAQRTSEDKRNPPLGRAQPVTHTHITHCIHTHTRIHTDPHVTLETGLSRLKETARNRKKERQQESERQRERQIFILLLTKAYQETNSAGFYSVFFTLNVTLRIIFEGNTPII